MAAGSFGESTHYYIDLDISASISHEDFAGICRGLADFSEGIRKQDRITLLTFGDEVRVEWTATGAELKKDDTFRQMLEGIENHDMNTALYEALSETAQLIEKDKSKAPRAETASKGASSTGRHVLWLITDGADDAAEASVTREEALNHLAQADSKILAFAPEHTKQEDMQALRELAVSTGGEMRTLSYKGIFEASESSAAFESAAAKKASDASEQAGSENTSEARSEKENLTVGRAGSAETEKTGNKEQEEQRTALTADAKAAEAANLKTEEGQSAQRMSGLLSEIAYGETVQAVLPGASKAANLGWLAGGGTALLLAVLLLILALRSRRKKGTPAKGDDAANPENREITLRLNGAKEPLHLTIKKSLIVGRGTGCSLRFADPARALQHFALGTGKRRVTVRDLTDGTTFVNGRALDKKERVLHPGDVISAGNVQMKISWA